MCQYISGWVSMALFLWCKGPVFKSCIMTGKYKTVWVLNVFTFTKLSHVRFENWVNSQNELFFWEHVRIWNIYQARTTGLALPSRALYHIRFWCSMLTICNLHCLCVNMYLVFNPWWMFSPSHRLMCTNKTCFAGVVTGQQTIFRIKNSFSFICMRIKKNSNISVSRSDFDSLYKPYVFAETVLEWNLIFVLLSRVNHGLTQPALVPPLIVLTSALSRPFRRKGHDTVQKTILWGQIASDCGWLVILSKLGRFGGDEQGSEAIKWYMTPSRGT